MRRYRVEIKHSAAKEIRSLDSAADRSRIMEQIGALADDPRSPGCRKMAGADAWRLRIGRFRIVYTVNDAIVPVVVVVVKVGDRREVYR